MKEQLESRRQFSSLLATAIAIGLCALLVLVLGACGSSNNSTSSGSASGGASSSASTSRKIDISNFEFVPKSVTVKASTPVTWTNKDSSAHTATAAGPGGGFDTGTLQQGDSKTLKVAPGTYHYICDIHPFMKATLLVK